MENRTKAIKVIAENFKLINPDDYPEIKDELSTLSKLLEGVDQLLGPLRQLKALIPQYVKELNFTTDEQFLRALNYNKTRVDEMLKDVEDEDFDKIFTFGLALHKYRLSKVGFFSKEKKEISLVIKHLEGVIERKDELFDYIINKMVPMLNKHINLMQIKKGDMSELNEITDVNILLKKDEKCYIKVGGVELFEDVSVRNTVGGLSGFSFRIAKGVSYRIGGFKARGESHLEKRLMDKGAFYVTNKRFIYDGAGKNIDGDLEEIISVEAYSDGIKISRINKRDEVFAGDTNWEYVGAVISGLVKNLK